MRISDWSSDVCSSDLRLCRAIGDVGGKIALGKLAGKHRRIVDVRIPERDIAGARFARGFLSRVLTRVEIARCLARDRQRTTRHPARKKGDRGDKIARQNADINRKSTRLNSSRYCATSMPSSA